QFNARDISRGLGEEVVVDASGGGRIQQIETKKCSHRLRHQPHRIHAVLHEHVPGDLTVGAVIARVCRIQLDRASAVRCQERISNANVLHQVLEIDARLVPGCGIDCIANDAVYDGEVFNQTGGDGRCSAAGEAGSGASDGRVNDGCGLCASDQDGAGAAALDGL